tara:strand:+ start:415 stop:621 length:207 start_codon:yes stop_codon:yes gene_type:complete
MKTLVARINSAATNRIDSLKEAGLITKEEAYQMVSRVNELSTCYTLYGTILTDRRRKILINNLVGIIA